MSGHDDNELMLVEGAILEVVTDLRSENECAARGSVNGKGATSFSRQKN